MQADRYILQPFLKVDSETAADNPTLRIRGIINSSNTEATISEGVVHRSGTMNSYTPQDADAPVLTFASQKIRYLPNFTITWEIFVNNAWIEIGKSVNTLYVTRMSATLPGGGQQPNDPQYETVVKIGTVALNGLAIGTSEAEVADAIWAKFATRDVRDSNNTTLRYQHTGNTGASVYSLLRWGNGMCGAWARFLRDIFLVQGVAAQVKAVQEPANPTELAQVLPLLPAGIGVDNVNSGIRTKAMLAQGSGTQLYENLNFLDHAIVTIAGIDSWFDPSYGTRFDSDQFKTAHTKWEETAVDRFLYVFKNPNGTPVSTLFLTLTGPLPDGTVNILLPFSVSNSAATETVLGNWNN